MQREAATERSGVTPSQKPTSQRHSNRSYMFKDRMTGKSRVGQATIEADLYDASIVAIVRVNPIRHSFMRI